MARPLDFLVIGAGMSGTTSLWRGMDSHPQIRVPPDKERGFFNSDGRYEKGLDRFISATFPDAGDAEVIGTVTPALMTGEPEALDQIVDRIRETCPEVKLIALLRDPIERAVSHYRRGLRSRSNNAEAVTFDSFVEARIRNRRGRVLKDVPLVRASLYGWVLSKYLQAFDQEQILVLFTADLDQRPDHLYQQLFSFLGVDENHHVVGQRMNVGGTKRRVSPEAIDELLVELDRSGMAADSEARRGYEWWLRQIWNCEPDEQQMEMSDEMRRRLAEVFLTDAEILEAQLAVQPPWLDSLRAARGDRQAAAS